MNWRSWPLGTPAPSTVEQWRAVWQAPVIRTGPADPRRQTAQVIEFEVDGPSRRGTWREETGAVEADECSPRHHVIGARR